jgi:general secretion pathway protein K
VSATTPFPRARTQMRESGYVLVSVLWLLGLLALALTTMSLFTVGALSVVATSSDRLTVDALTHAGLESSFIEILRTPPKKSVRGSAQWRLTGGVVKASWVGENGRIDINLAPIALISSLLGSVTDDDQDTPTLLNIITARRPGPPGSQRPLGPFRHIGELVVAGFPPAVVARLEPYITVYGGSERVNPRLASRRVLSLLPDVSEPRLRGLVALQATDTADMNAWTQEAGSAAAPLLSTERGPTIRVRLKARLDNGFQSTSEVVIVVFPDDTEPYRVMSWVDRSASPDVGDLDGDLE